MGNTFTTGLMGAGKSKELIEKYLEDYSKRIAFAASLFEKTGKFGKIESRNGTAIPAIYLNKDQIEESLELIKRYAFMKNIDTIYIDEVQFLPSSIIAEIIKLSNETNISVHFFGLSITFTAEPFDSSRFLLEEVIDYLYLPMKCESEFCEDLAEFNARIVDGKVAREGDTFVSEKDKYLALCKKCYFS